MNLHNARFLLHNFAIWVTVWGGNGHYIGNHAWVVEEGTPPEGPETRPAWQAYGWQPRRFYWRPFDIGNLFRTTGYYAPLCGHRSTSLSPRTGPGYTLNACQDCQRVARERGIVVLTHDEATQNSATRLAILQEQQEWMDAGRPETWPVSTT